MTIEDNKLRESFQEMAKRFDAEKCEMQKKVKDILEKSSFLKARTKPMDESIQMKETTLNGAKKFEEEKKDWDLDSTHDQFFGLMERYARLETEILEIKKSHRVEIENLEKQRQADLAKAAESHDGDVKRMMQMLNEERLKWREKLHLNSSDGKGANDGDQ
mgnify:CR=1 FL=1